MWDENPTIQGQSLLPRKVLLNCIHKSQFKYLLHLQKKEKKPSKNWLIFLDQITNISKSY